MLWHAMPPELNTARLMLGAGPGPMLQSAAGWHALGAALETQADELAAILSGLAAVWTGASGERAIASASPMVGWLKAAATQSNRRGQQAAAQAAAYTSALATTPSLAEIAANHVTRAALLATNFFGINTVPIGLKETDYFVRMWNQAAAAMDVYQAETAANTIFEPLPPLKPIVIPEAGQAAQAGAMAKLTELAATAANSQALAGLTPEAIARNASSAMTSGGQLMPFLSQLSQLGGPMQQLTQLLQPQGGVGELTQLARRDETPHMGLLGATPLSTHPLAGGSGPSTGAGLLRAESLPGLGGTSPRTAMLSQLLDKAAVAVTPAAAGPSAGASAAGGAAPLGMAGHGAQTGSLRTLAPAPAVLASGPEEQEWDESVDDEDDW